MHASVTSRTAAGANIRHAAILVAILLAGCQAGPAPTGGPSGQTASGSPSASATSGPTASPAGSPSVPGVTSAPPSAQARIAVGALAVTVSPGVRVRSEPRVADDSLKYTPLLPLGTTLVVAAGPVKGSDYTWVRVAPIGVSLDGGIDQGWVAVADHDGTPWVALAPDPTPGFELASAPVAVPAADVAAATREATALNAFGVDLYRRMIADPNLELGGKGVVLSPESIVTALGMARAGAKGPTATEMDAVLHVTGWDALATGLSSLDQLLRSRDAAWSVTGERSTDTHFLALRQANMAFAQDGYALEGAYLERIGRTFGAGLGTVDYRRDSGGALDAINGWVSRQTMARIPHLLTPLDVTTATRLVLVNAVYLKAEWARQFAKEDTTARPFTTAAGTRLNVPTMHVTGGQDIPFATGPGWRATRLAYAGAGDTRPLAMTLIVPDSLATFESALTPTKLASIDATLSSEQEKIATSETAGAEDCGSYAYNTEVYLPRFGIDLRAKLNDALKSLGMTTAFDTSLADFTGITATDRLHVGVVIHQANIDVDEEGTEAAAATAIGMDTGGCTGPQPLQTRTIRFDRPFLFELRDTQTNAILFLGRVTDPTRR